MTFDFSILCFWQEHILAVTKQTSHLFLTSIDKGKMKEKKKKSWFLYKTIIIRKSQEFFVTLKLSVIWNMNQGGNSQNFLSKFETFFL